MIEGTDLTFVYFDNFLCMFEEKKYLYYSGHYLKLTIVYVRQTEHNRHATARLENKIP